MLERLQELLRDAAQQGPHAHRFKQELELLAEPGERVQEPFDQDLILYHTLLFSSLGRKDLAARLLSADELQPLREEPAVENLLGLLLVEQGQLQEGQEVLEDAYLAAGRQKHVLTDRILANLALAQQYSNWSGTGQNWNTRLAALDSSDALVQVLASTAAVRQADSTKLLDGALRQLEASTTALAKQFGEDDPRRLCFSATSNSLAWRLGAELR